LAPAASEELKDSAVTLDTDFNGDGYTGYAGYTNYTFDLATGPAEPINPVFPPLDPSAGFTVSFNLAIDSEGSLSNNRAGFSVIAVSSDGQNEIELGFDADRIFAQAQEFVSGEEVEFDTTSPTDYELQIEGSDYALLANDEEILSGSLRNYDFDPAASQPPLPFNPYDLPNMVFLGDNTDQSSATFTLGSVEVETEDDEPPEPANPVEVKVIVENLAPENGTYLTPVWIGFQNGGFDTYDSGAPLTVGGERMAEDGDASELSQEFLDSGYGVVDATIGGGPIAPGETVMETFILDSNDERSRFLDYFSMVIPSNDAFIANGNPEAHEIFDEDGNFIGADFLVLGNEVNDGGTEVNDELPENTAFFGQTMGNTGVTEGGVVTDHPGFNPVGSGGILDDPMFANADFTVPGYEVARITVTLDTGENNAPEAVDDFVATFSGEAIAVDVLANDNDPDGDDLELSGWDASSEFGGTIALSDGELEYTPAAGFIGTDSFTYTLSDGDLTDTATVSVTVEEEPEPEPVEVKVTYYNLAPEDGTVVSPLWVGFHNGTFDIYDVGSPAPERLERLAEDGDSAILSQEFIGSGYGLVEGRIEGTAQFNAVLPGDSAMETFTLDVNDECECYFSYAAMVLPSNDAFIANNNPEGIEIFDEEGNFIGADFIIAGERVYDAGTEVNDEVPENTALLNQMVPNTGVDENGVVGLHPGFLANGNILTAFPGADFTAPGYQVARITIERDIPIDDPVNLTSVLTGDQEVPPVETEARGTAEMTLNETGDAFSYSITVSGLDFGELIGDGTPQTPSTDDDVTGLHIHNAPRGENGPVVFGQINPNQDDDDISFVLNQDGSTTISGIWEETDPADAPLSDFVDVLQGNQPGDEVDFYWNIHTEEFPSGEIRGQFQIASAPPTVNTPPVASDDRASTDIDTPVEIDVLANDMDADGNPLTLSIVTAPSNGTALVNDQGTPDPSDDDINYTPNSGFQGTDQFAYQADDGNGGTDTATVTVRVGTAPTRDRIDGSGQDDLLIGTPDDDDIRGRAGNDELRGEQGNDLLVGGQNDDTLIGGVDNDILFGGPGNDFFDGGAGDDIIRGGLGQDLMLGGDGADIFVLSTNGAVDSRIDADAILTFEVGIDSIGLTDGLTEADLELQQLGTNTLIRLASNGQYLGHVNRVEVAVLEGSFLSV